MRGAAMALGMIAGIIGIFIGMFSVGYSTLIERFGEVPDVFEQWDNRGLVTAVSVLSPLCAIAGGAMAKSRALWGGVLLSISALGMFVAFGYNWATMFPIGMAGLGGVLAIAAGQPDREHTHFGGKEN
jgi:hypothetical protein